jgi:hypothetical protein
MEIKMKISMPEARTQKYFLATLREAAQGVAYAKLYPQKHK